MNSRPPVPQTGALTRLRYAPTSLRGLRLPSLRCRNGKLRCFGSRRALLLSPVPRTVERLNRRVSPKFRCSLPAKQRCPLLLPDNVVTLKRATHQRLWLRLAPRRLPPPLPAHLRRLHLAPLGRVVGSGRDQQETENADRERQDDRLTELDCRLLRPEGTRQAAPPSGPWGRRRLAPAPSGPLRAAAGSYRPALRGLGTWGHGRSRIRPWLRPRRKPQRPWRLSPLHEPARSAVRPPDGSVLVRA